MNIGENAWRYLSAGLRGGPMAALDTADQLQRERKRHKRRKELKGETRNINLMISRKKKEGEKKKKKKSPFTTGGTGTASQLAKLLD